MVWNPLPQGETIAFLAREKGIWKFGKYFLPQARAKPAAGKQDETPIYAPRPSD
jgi:hypothetical protein